MVNIQVVNTAYSTANKMGADDKVMLALFEACIVESGFENLNYGDRDSLGVLQQRANWGSAAERLNVASSVSKFVTRANAIENKYGTSAQLAQAVQVSAYPAKYAIAMPQAQGLLAQAKVVGGSNTPSANPTGDPNNNDGGLSNAVRTFTDRNTYVRLGLFILGGVCILFALAKMTGNNQLSPVTKEAIKAVGMAAVA